MARSITPILDRFKRDPFTVLDRKLVEQVCAEEGYDNFRHRELDPATTIALFLQQVLRGNCPCSEVRHLAPAGKSFTAAAYCDARHRIPLAVYHALLTKVIGEASPLTDRDAHLWLGKHRVFHIDGSSFSMPDTEPLREAFGTPSGQAEGCSFPMAHLLVLFSAQTGVLLDVWAGRMHSADIWQVDEAVGHLRPGDVMIGDDSFGTYVHFALLLQNKSHGLFPAHHARIVSFLPHRKHTKEGKGCVAGLPRSRWIKSLGNCDQLVEYFKPKVKPDWIGQSQYDALPESITVREVRRRVRGPAGNRITLTMVTTLLDPKRYPADELTDLRQRRWDVETNLRHLKITMGLDVLRCESEAGVRKELAMFCLAYNLVRVVMVEAAWRQDVPVDRISFIDALKWMRHARPGDVMPRLIVNPHRPNRAEPRCKKRRAKTYDLMNKPRAELKKLLRKQRKKA